MLTANTPATVAELARDYASGQATPRDVIEAALDRIHRLDPTFRAAYVIDTERARIDADESTRRWAEGRAIGPLDGIPFTAKENQAREGLPQSYGTAGRTPVVADSDSPPVARLREAGAVFLASTTMPDLSGIGSGVSSRHGITRNAWNPNWNSAGSSSGSGVAAALGYAPINVGTDIGGSIRGPAAFNAAVGFKPTFGRVPILDTYTGRVAGPMTRTVADAAIAMSVLSLPDGRDWSALLATTVEWTDLDLDVAGLRIGLSLEPTVGMRAVPEVEQAIRRAAELFRAAGATVEEIDPYLTPQAARSWITLFSAHLWVQLHDPRIVDDIGAVNPDFVRGVAGVEKLSALELMQGVDGVQDLIARTIGAVEAYDLVLSPVMWTVAGAAESLMPELAGGPSFTPQHNATGAPAISINAGFSLDGKPIGLQIVGPRREDLRVLRAAQWYESHRGPDAAPDWSRLDAR